MNWLQAQTFLFPFTQVYIYKACNGTTGIITLPTADKSADYFIKDNQTASSTFPFLLQKHAFLKYIHEASSHKMIG